MKKKIIAAALAVSMMTTLAIGMTLAYFTDSKTANNTFTVGNVKIDLTEPKWVTSGSIDGKTVYAGEPLDKDPTVTNTGANPCFVRIKVGGLSLGQDLLITYRTKYVPGALGEGWVDGQDGYFYYTKVLDGVPGENAKYGLSKATSPLFDQIVMPTGLTNGDGLAKHVTVTAEAVQAQGAKGKFEDVVNTMTLQDIKTWFTKCMPAPTAS